MKSTRQEEPSAATRPSAGYTGSGVDLGYINKRDAHAKRSRAQGTWPSAAEKTKASSDFDNYFHGPRGIFSLKAVSTPPALARKSHRTPYMNSKRPYEATLNELNAIIADSRVDFTSAGASTPGGEGAFCEHWKISRPYSAAALPGFSR
jgi:hypothetical protein